MVWLNNVAPAIRDLFARVDRHYPGRETASDGTIGNATHQATKSDHNPNANGTVCAADVDLDTTPGPNWHVLMPFVIALKPAGIKYIIFNRRIISSYPSNGYLAWVSRPYSGLNAHTQHAHFSFYADAQNAEWFTRAVAFAYPNNVPAPVVTNPPVQNGNDEMDNLEILKVGSKGQGVRNVQGLLNAAGRKCAIDGDFGNGTRDTLAEWQRAAGLVPDGVCGPNSWGRFLGLR